MKVSIIVVVILLNGQLINAQNVGIGTTSPSEKLQVSGNIKADTLKPNALKLTPNAGEGKVLVSDALGNASWQATGNIGYGVWGDCATNGNIGDYQPVVDENPAEFDYFGTSTSISGNFAIVGAKGDDIGANDGQGSASIFQFNGTSWVFMQKIVDPAGAASATFGTSVYISGNYVIVGAPYDNGKGAACIFQYNGTSWVFMQKITDATGAADDEFGRNVCISGNYAIVAADKDDLTVALTDYGSASIYKFNGTSWVLMQKLIDATGGTNFRFGYSVSISGNNAIIGARYEKVGANGNQGSASIYQFNGTAWLLKNKLTEINGEVNDWLGCSTSISGDYAAVGVNGDNPGVGGIQGSVNIYKFDGTNWVFTQKVSDPTDSTSDAFGSFVNLSGNYLIASPYKFQTKGSATIYSRIGLGWYKVQTVMDPAGESKDLFGYNPTIDGASKRFVVGVPFIFGNSGKVVFGKVN